MIGGQIGNTVSSITPLQQAKRIAGEKLEKAVLGGRIENALVRMAQFNMKDSSNFIKYTGAFINVYAGLCQTCAFAFNKKIPEDTRRFMVWQEVFEAIISTILMFKTADILHSIGEKLVDKCVLLPEIVHKDLRDPKKIEGLMGNKSIAEIFGNSKPSQELVKKLGNKAYVEKLQNSIRKCKSGVGAATVVLGEIIAFNVFTPIIVNKFASYFKNKKQKECEAKHKDSFHKSENCNFPLPSAHVPYMK